MGFMKTEDLIIKNADRLNWLSASKKIDIPNFDKDIVKEFKYKWDWNAISFYHRNCSFIKENFKEHLNMGIFEEKEVYIESFDFETPLKIWAKLLYD